MQPPALTQPAPVEDRWHLLLPASALAVLLVLAIADHAGVWHLVRASGIVAYGLLTFSVCCGLLYSSRSLPAGNPRADLFEVHNFTALLALCFVVLHAFLLLFDSFVGFSLAQVLLPLTSDYRPLAVALGICALYVLALVYVSSRLRQRIGLRLWRRIHYASFFAYAVATLHGLLAGTDTGQRWMLLVYGLSLGAVGLLLARRLAVSSALRPARV